LRKAAQAAGPPPTGHGIGLDVHEWPYLVKGDKTMLQRRT